MLCRLSSTVPSPPTWPSPRRHRSSASGPTAGPTPSTALASRQRATWARWVVGWGGPCTLLILLAFQQSASQQLLVLFQFAEKFAEFKEAARLAKEKSQEKTELSSTPSQVTNTVCVILYNLSSPHYISIEWLTKAVTLELVTFWELKRIKSFLNVQLIAFAPVTLIPTKQNNNPVHQAAQEEHKLEKL